MQADEHEKAKAHLIFCISFQLMRLHRTDESFLTLVELDGPRRHENRLGTVAGQGPLDMDGTLPPISINYNLGGGLRKNFRTLG